MIHTSLFNQILGIMKTPLINKEVQEMFWKIIKKINVYAVGMDLFVLFEICIPTAYELK